MTNPTDDGDLVGLEALAWTSPEAEPSPGQFAGDLVHAYRQAGGKPLDDGDKPTPMGLSGGQKAQHELSLRRGRSRQTIAGSHSASASTKRVCSITRLFAEVALCLAKIWPLAAGRDLAEVQGLPPGARCRPDLRPGPGWERNAARVKGGQEPSEQRPEDGVVSNQRHADLPTGRGANTRDGVQEGLLGPLLDTLPVFDTRSDVDRPEALLDLRERVPGPLAIETVPQAVVYPERSRRGADQRTRRVDRPPQRARHDGAQGYEAKQFAERKRLGSTRRAERDVELSPQNTGGIESRLTVPHQKDMVCPHVQTR